MEGKFRTLSAYNQRTWCWLHIFWLAKSKVLQNEMDGRGRRRHMGGCRRYWAVSSNHQLTEALLISHDSELWRFNRMFPNLVEDFWARIDTSIEKESSGAETAEDLDYDPTLARSPNSDYNSVEDADFRQPTSSSSSSSSEEGDAASVESNDDRWLSVRSIEGMDKTIDGSQRVYIRW